VVVDPPWNISDHLNVVVDTRANIVHVFATHFPRRSCIWSPTEATGATAHVPLDPSRPHDGLRAGETISVGSVDLQVIGARATAPNTSLSGH